MAMQTTTRRRDLCSLRMQNEDVLLIERAAQARGMTQADFIVLAARQAAQHALQIRQPETVINQGDATVTRC